MASVIFQAVPVFLCQVVRHPWDGPVSALYALRLFRLCPGELAFAVWYCGTCSVVERIDFKWVKWRLCCEIFFLQSGHLKIGEWRLWGLCIFRKAQQSAPPFPVFSVTILWLLGAEQSLSLYQVLLFSSVPVHSTRPFSVSFIARCCTIFFINIFWGIFSFFLSYYIQHCFICRPSDSTVPTDAGIEPRTVATGALAVRPSNH